MAFSIVILPILFFLDFLVKTISPTPSTPVTKRNYATSTSKTSNHKYPSFCNTIHTKDEAPDDHMEKALLPPFPSIQSEYDPINSGRQANIIILPI